ncbi:DNA repair protein RecO [Staphylococcus massiliensis]|uniref:DNA repair protein RecO n=1 Tax=Staphylococcus massiliensis S46 TaxID=1229783 RepID=K9AV12_9STAP|nr:DNA repair protein RecO [Staphylococcus massiliensis]EKU49906.1 DNA repair protein RecO [Staphylococcus massiliensis S46]MCG3399010.1 DNA repair protein RecO [Staphylococcus massiliensis]MCG3400992.1 DNA repair protein RecO [Staphylococcus massiliensis]PNZ98906.1 DNA repair protein RecO [Staphylococcus massiliensis CCUG 55927]
MLQKQKGVIIKSVDYGESDKVITILNEHGSKVPLMVRRAKKSKKGLQASTQLFVYGLFIYSKWRGMGTLTSVDVIDRHYPLQLDIYKSSYVSLCAEIIDRGFEDQISEESFKLLQFALTRIEADVSPQLVANIVFLKCMYLFGFQLDFTTCAITHDTDQSHLAGYSFKFDGPISEKVLHQDPHAVRIKNRTFYLMDVLQHLPIDKMKSITINEDILTEMNDLLLMLYREYAGVFFKGQKLINQLKRFEQSTESD